LTPAGTITSSPTRSRAEHMPGRRKQHEAPRLLIAPGWPRRGDRSTLSDRMKPDTHTVQQLFERDVRYSVPLYQRPYVWDEEHQWAPLWEDISALLQHQESGALSDLWSH
jgi:Protein of unknown function DUF262